MYEYGYDEAAYLFADVSLIGLMNLETPYNCRHLVQALAETMLVTEGAGLPIAIVREEEECRLYIPQQRY